MDNRCGVRYQYTGAGAAGGIGNRGDRIAARVAADQPAILLQDLERHRTARRRLQVVVDDRALGRIRRRRLLFRPRHVDARIPPHTPGGRRLEQDGVLRGRPCIHLTQRRDVVEDPETAAVRRGDHVVVLDDEVADRRYRHVQPQRLPVGAIVERYVDGTLGAGKQQALALGIFAHGVDRLAVRNAVDDLGPGLAAVVRAEDVRPQVVEAQRVDCRVGGQRSEASGVHDRHLGPRADARRRDILPGHAVVGRHMDQPVVGADPDPVDVLVRRRDGVDDAARRGLRRRIARILADARRHGPRLARQVGAQLLPVRAAVDGLPEMVVGEEQRTLVDFGEDDRHRAHLTEGPGWTTDTTTAAHRADDRHLTGPAIESRHGAAAVDDVGIERVWGDEAVFIDADGKPVAIRDRAVVAAARHAHRAVLLLAAADAVGKRVVRRHVVELAGRLVVPGAPGLAAVQRDDRALIGGEQDDVGVVGIDPAVLIVLAAWRAFERRPRLAAVGRLPRRRCSP